MSITITVDIPETTCARCDERAPIRFQNVRRVGTTDAWEVSLVNATRSPGWAPTHSNPADLTRGLCADCAATWKKMVEVFLASPGVRAPAPVAPKKTPAVEMAAPVPVLAPVLKQQQPTSSSVRVSASTQPPRAAAPSVVSVSAPMNPAELVRAPTVRLNAPAAYKSQSVREVQEAVPAVTQESAPIPAAAPRTQSISTK